MYDLTVVIPTYNEAENVRPLFALLQKTLAGTKWEAVYVDDDSPDGTANAVRALATEQSNVRVLHRIGRRGLSGACIEGILSSTATFCAVIDADLQHDETRLAVMLGQLENDTELDIVIGSRHVDGGSHGTGFTALREWGSNAANATAKRLLRITATDPMSGFFMVRRASFLDVAPELQTAGFKVLSDMLSASRGTWKISEVPYTFRSRQAGESKMSTAVTLEFAALLLARLTGGKISVRFVLFAAVGLSGVFVQLLGVRLALAAAPDQFALAQGIGVMIAIFSNFVLNNTLTYRDRTLRGRAFWRGLASFYVVCAFGALLNIGFADLVYGHWPMWAIASIAGAFAGALWNFIASAFFTWRSH